MSKWIWLVGMALLLGVLEVTSDKVDEKLGGTAGMKALIACGRSGQLGVSKCDIQSLCGPSSQANWCAGEQSCAQCCSCQRPSVPAPHQCLHMPCKVGI